MTAFPQPLMLALTALVPAYLIYFKKNSTLTISWLTLITVFDIFNSQQYMNLAAVLIFGAVAVPHVWINRNDLSQNPALKIFCVYFAYLTLLGIYHGFVVPWPDTTGLRSVKDQAQFRAILHLGRTFCECMAILYVTLELQKNKLNVLNTFLKTVFYSSIALALSAFLERTIPFDFYHFFTGGRELLLLDRPRGFDYEPRGLAQNLSYAILLTPFVPIGKWRFLLIPFFAFFSIFYTISFTGLMVLVTGMCLLAAAYLLTNTESLKTHIKKMIVVAVGAVVILGLSLFALPKKSSNHLEERFAYFSKSNFAEKLEVFDAASINFLNHNPKYYLLGTGPGLIYLPAGDYIVERDKGIWGNHFEALPHMGIVLTISNAGILGLILILIGVFVGLRNKVKTDPVFFILGTLLFGIFLVQLRYYFIFGFAFIIFSTMKPQKKTYV